MKPKQKPLVKVTTLGKVNFQLPTVAHASALINSIGFFIDCQQINHKKSMTDRCITYTAWRLAMDTINPRRLKQSITKAEACVLVQALAPCSDVFFLNLKAELHRLL